MAHAEIALAVGVSRNTLEKHFRSELTEPPKGSCFAVLPQRDEVITIEHVRDLQDSGGD